MKAPFTFAVIAPSGWRWRPIVRRHGGGRRRSSVGGVLPHSAHLDVHHRDRRGPYHRVESQWRRGDLDVPLGLLCRASLARYLDADTIFEVTRQGLDFFAENFDYPYPWGKYDQVFVPEYNLGAMENPGCVTFTEAYVFRGAATAAQYEGRANTILHEMAHMWFGDLVTMVWWDDLWLKESFADYMGALASAEATEWTDAWGRVREPAQGVGVLAGPVAHDAPDRRRHRRPRGREAELRRHHVREGCQRSQATGGVRRPGCILRRSAPLLPQARVRQHHPRGPAVGVVGGVRSRPRRWAHAWLRTTGVSTLILAAWRRRLRDRADRSSAAPDRRGYLRLRRLGKPRPTRSRGAGPRERTHTTVELPDAPLRLLNDGDLTYAKVRFDADSLATVERSLDRVVDPLTRGLIWSALWNATRDGRARARALSCDGAGLRAVREQHGAHGSGPRECRVRRRALSSGPDARRVARPLARSCWGALWDAQTGSGAQLAWARAVAGAAVVDDRFAVQIRACSTAPRRRPTGCRSIRTCAGVVDRAGRHGACRRGGSRRRTRRPDDTASGRTAHLRALTARPLAEVKDEAWRAALEDPGLSNDQLDAVIGGFRAGDRRDLIGSYDDGYFAALRDVWATRSIEIARRIVLGLFPSSESLDPVDAWLTANTDAPGALRRLVVEQRDHLARDLRVGGSVLTTCDVVLRAGARAFPFCNGLRFKAFTAWNPLSPSATHAVAPRTATETKHQLHGNKGEDNGF